MADSKNTAQKTIDSYKKHEGIVENAVKLGKEAGLSVEATDNNNSKGDIKIKLEDFNSYITLLGETIDKNQKKGGT